MRPRQLYRVDQRLIPRGVCPAVQSLQHGRVPANGAIGKLKRQELRTAFGRDPLLETSIDPDLLGGLTVQVGDVLYDASIRTRLEQMRTQLIERSSHAIQSQRDRFSSPA